MAKKSTKSNKKSYICISKYVKQLKQTNMKTFELNAWMSENREVVIEKYNKLNSEQFFNGISLKDFMLQVLHLMKMNNIKSEKRAASMLPFLMGDVYVKNSKVEVINNRDSKLSDKYNGTAYMALV